MSFAWTDTPNGLLIFAHILYVDPEMCNKPNDAVIVAFSDDASATLSANVGKVTIMHIKSASVIQRTFLFIMTSKNEFRVTPNIKRHRKSNKSPFMRKTI